MVPAVFLRLYCGGGLGQLGPLDQATVGQGDTPSEISQQCRTGQDANERDDCRIVAVVNSVQKFWDGVFQRSNRQYQYADTIFFTDQVETGCGFADAQVGPFYCPADKLVYIDLGFFDELQSRFGVNVSPFVQAYVIAHEYGHHVQDLLGVLEQIRGATPGPESKAVRSELQADDDRDDAAVVPLVGVLAGAALLRDLRRGVALPDRGLVQRPELSQPAACDTFSGSI